MDDGMRLPAIPGTPVEQQRADWIGEAQDGPGYPWVRVAGPGTVKAVMRATKRYRESQDHLLPETRVRLP